MRDSFRRCVAETFWFSWAAFAAFAASRIICDSSLLKSVKSVSIVRPRRFRSTQWQRDSNLAIATADPEPDPENQLLPVNVAVRSVIQRKSSPSTTSRWYLKGFACPDGTRCLLKVWYVGRTPHTTRAAVKEWVEAVTAARLSKPSGASEPVDVTEAELRAAGLISD